MQKQFKQAAVAVLASVVGVVGLMSSQAAVAGGEVVISRGKQASVGQHGQLDACTYYGVSIVAAERMERLEPGSAPKSVVASFSYVKYNMCTNEYLYGGGGSDQLQLAISPALNKASLKGTMRIYSVGNSQCYLQGCSSEVNLDVTWSGEGQITKENSRDVYDFDNNYRMVHLIDGNFRAANTQVNVSGVLNVNAQLPGKLGTSRDSRVFIETPTH